MQHLKRELNYFVKILIHRYLVVGIKSVVVYVAFAIQLIDFI